jgi:hypothetical protein
MDPPVQLHFTWILQCEIWIFQSPKDEREISDSAFGYLRHSSSCNDRNGCYLQLIKLGIKVRTPNSR